MNLVVGIVIGAFGSMLIGVFKSEWAKRFPIAQIALIAYILNIKFPHDFLAVAIGCVGSFIGWLAFLWAEKHMGQS